MRKSISTICLSIRHFCTIWCATWRPSSKAATIEIERLQLIIKKLQGAQFGRRSERLDPDQMALALEDLNSDVARVRESRPAIGASADETPGETRSRRKPLPDHMPREDVRLDVDSQACACCGGALQAIGESMSEMLDWVPAPLRVIRILASASTPAAPAAPSTRHPAPERPIAGGHSHASTSRPGAGRQVLRSHAALPAGPDLRPTRRRSGSLDAGQLGRRSLLVAGAAARAAGRNVFASNKLFADDTPIPVLDPGRGRTKTGRLWVYARDDRPWGGPTRRRRSSSTRPTARRTPASHLERFRGVLQVDGYAGFERLAAGGNVVLAACWAHARRKFYEVAQATSSPIAAEALSRIAELYAVEARIRGQRRRARRTAVLSRRWSRPCALGSKRNCPAFGRGALADAIRYALTRWQGLPVPG